MPICAKIKPLSWDSTFFNMSIAALTEINGSESPLLHEADLNLYQLVQAKIAANNYDALSGLQSLGFQVVDGEVDLAIAVSGGEKHSNHTLSVAMANDIPQITALASMAFQQTRFRAPWFNELDCSRFYATWAQKAVTGDFDNVCLIAHDDNQSVKGFITLKHVENGDVRVGLLAVSPDYRQQGIGERLMSGALMYAQGRQANVLRVATQIGNIAAQRLYLKSGAMVTSQSYWLYRLCH